MKVRVYVRGRGCMGHAAEMGGAVGRRIVRVGSFRPDGNLTDSVRHFYAGLTSVDYGSEYAQWWLISKLKFTGMGRRDTGSGGSAASLALVCAAGVYGGIDRGVLGLDWAVTVGVGEADSSAVLRNDSQKSKSRSRFPRGMTERKATAAARRTARIEMLCYALRLSSLRMVV